MRLPDCDSPMFGDESYRIYDMDQDHRSIDQKYGEDKKYINEFHYGSYYPEQNRTTVVNWNPRKIYVDRILQLCEHNNIEYDEFNLSVIRDAKDLNEISRDDFIQMSPEYGGFLYQQMQTTYPFTNRLIEDLPHQTTVPRRAPGRPRTSNKIRHKSEKKTGKVWQFLLNLLKDPSNEHMIAWEDRSEGLFKFNSSEKVAKLWGSMRGNKKMNYEKLSRAMRYYYKSKILLPVLGKRLVYKFGPNAPGWRLPGDEDDVDK